MSGLLSSLMAAWVGCVSLGLSPTPDVPGQVDLRPHFRAGVPVRFVLDMESSMPGPEEGRTEQRLELRLVPTREDEAERTRVGVFVDAARVKLDAGGLKLEADTGGAPGAQPAKTLKPASSKPAPKPARSAPRTPTAGPEAPQPDGVEKLLQEQLSQALRGMLGEVLTFEVDQSGNVVEVAGGEKLAPGSPFAGLPELGGGGGGGGMPPAGAMRWLISSAPESGFARTGQTWTTDQTLASTPVGAMRLTMTHELRSVRSGMAEIPFTGQLVPGGGAGALGVGNVAAKYRLKGVTKWNVGLGMLDSLDLDVFPITDGSKSGEADAGRPVARIRLKSSP